MRDFSHSTPLFGTNAVYVQEIYERYLQNPDSVDASWHAVFSEMQGQIGEVMKERSGASWAPRDLAVVGAKIQQEDQPKNKEKAAPSKQACSDSINALMLIRAYKVRGNLLADLDPLGLEGHHMHPDLDPATYGFAPEDFDRKIYLGGALGIEYATLNELIPELRQTYSAKIGVEFMHMPSLEQREWIAARMEQVRGKPVLSAEDKRSILEDIVKVQEFEQFLHVKFPGAKRFSAEGGEAVIAGMEKIIEAAAGAGVEEVLIGMPHRGRLNVLTKVMGKSYAAMLAEFQGKIAHASDELEASGDVKYHQGMSSDRDFDGHKVHLSLSANPSHLEAVNPVVAGRVRAKQDQKGDTERKKVLGVLLHGDAAFAGQGVVPETLALSDLAGYTTGGTIHIIVNNQIGFTTSPKNARISPYPSDIAKGAHAPIFHVNGDDPEAVAFVSKLALEFRQEFGVDVVLDVFCYRRYGHNEGDEPFFTQPLMYSKIKAHPTPMEVYAKQLMAEGAIDQAGYDQIRADFKAFLNKEFEVATAHKTGKVDWLRGRWKGFTHRHSDDKAKTGVKLEILKKIGLALASYPKEHKVHSKLVRLHDTKRKMIESGKGLDWAMGEALAYGTLLAEGSNVRLSGQDCTRGTFSHRHSALVDQESEARYYPLNNLGVKDQAHYEVIDSNLSEFAVLGFEHGYSLAEPDSLTIWEAQFGDFANGAQVMIDQFISSSEIKWFRLSGLVMLLPHGYEGQGPEHSSARLERFLQLCAEDNMRVVNCTTPANFFHVLRRQIHDNVRKPLVVMTPKSLLRHKLCVSDLEAFTPKHHFQRVIEEQDKLKPADKIRRVVLCSGKVYYELLETRRERNIDDVALIRLEQYYPFPEKRLVEALKPYKNAEFVWCQEEPENMGAWHFVDRKLEAVLKKAKVKHDRPSYAGRSALASPAAGYASIHKKKQAALIDAALGV